VLIYFDDKAKQKAVSLLYDSLRPGGFLFVGSAESLHSVTRAFKPVVFDKVVVYQRV
jgi:chemotaxis protein methyltransferase CheR